MHAVTSAVEVTEGAGVAHEMERHAQCAMTRAAAHATST